MERFLSDLRFGLRVLRKDPLFTVAAVAVLALGIGATTTIFSVVHGILLRPLPLPQSSRLVIVCEEHPRVAGFCIASASNIANWAERARTLEALGVARSWPLTVRMEGETEGVPGGLASPGYFRALGVSAALGRLFDPNELGSLDPHGSAVGPDMPHVAVLTHAFWTSRFGGDPDVVGRTIHVEDESFTIIGVLPADAVAPDLAHVRLWLPLPFEMADPDTRSWRGFLAIGRLAPGSSLEAAQSELETIGKSLTEEYPAANEGWDVRVRSLHDYIVGDVRPTLLVFLGAVGLVLLIACFNVANLMLARSARRETEFAVRAAVGAGRPRLAGQMLTEGMLLAIAAGGAGAVLALWATDLFKALAPPGIPRVQEVGVDATVLAFALLVSLATSALFGLGPVLRARRLDLSRTLQQGRPGGAGRVSSRVRRGLVVSEIGMALALLIAAGLLLRTFVRFVEWEPGFDRGNLITVPAFSSASKYRTSEQVAQLWKRSAEELSALPGVVAAATASAGPLFGGRETATATTPGAADADDEGVSVRWYDVSPDYFTTLGIPLLAGRWLAESDTRGGPAVAVVNEALARRLWSGRDAVGQQVAVIDGELVLEVVGVVRNVDPIVPGRSPEPEIYWSNRQFPRWASFILIRTAGDPTALIEPVRDRLEALDPDLDLGSFLTMAELVDRQLVRPRFNMMLIGGFAAVALALAAVGLYGVVAYTIATRRHEIGIRIALGADGRRVLRGVLREGAVLIALGVLIGLAGALAASRLLSSLLHGVVPTDPLTYVGTSALLALVALAACSIPAFRASRVDPVTVLRSE